jgi:hypothetical protein
VGGQTLAGLLIAAAAAVLVVYASRHATRSGIAIVLIVFGGLWLLSTRRTQLALAGLMLYLGLLDGYLKLSSGSNLVTFVRDGLLYAIVIGLLVRATVKHKRLALPPMSLWVVAFVILVLIELLNPDDGSLYHSLAGVRQDLEFVPLFFLTFAFVRSTKSLRMFVILLAVIAAANGIANIVQFRETPQQLASWGPGYKERVLGTSQFSAAGRLFYAGGHQRTRPFGLMGDAGTGGLVCALALGAILALGSLRNRRRYLVLAVLAGALAVAGILTSQGRAVVVGSVVVLLAYALLSATTGRGIATALAASALVGVAVLAVTVVIGSGSGAAPVRYQGLTPGGIVQLTNQNRGASFRKIPENFVHYPFGGGLGTGGPAAGVSGAPTSGADTENEFSYLTLEAGIPGMLLVIGFTVAVCLLGIRYCRHEPDPEARILLAAITAPVVGILVLYSVNVPTPTTPGGPYLWAVGGIATYWLIVRPAERRRAGALAAAA